MKTTTIGAAVLVLAGLSLCSHSAEIKVVTEYRYPTSFTIEPIVGQRGGGGGGVGFNVSQPVGAVVEPGDFETREVGARLEVYAAAANPSARFGALRRSTQQKVIHGNTDLMLASARGDTREVQRLLASDTDVNARNRNGATALMGAAAGGFDDVLQLLLAREADVNNRSHKGHTALMYAARNGHTDSVARLLALGADVNGTNIEGRSALMYAISAGHEPAARALLKHGADVALRDRRGKDALQFAENRKDRDLVVLLTRAQPRR
jgi:ankyrin repeat protein